MNSKSPAIFPHCPYRALPRLSTPRGCDLMIIFNDLHPDSDSWSSLPFHDCLLRPSTLGLMPAPRSEDEGRPIVGRFHCRVESLPCRLLRAFSRYPDRHSFRTVGERSSTWKDCERTLQCFYQGQRVEHHSVCATLLLRQALRHPQFFPTTWHCGCHRVLPWVFKLFIATV